MRLTIAVTLVRRGGVGVAYDISCDIGGANEPGTCGGWPTTKLLLQRVQTMLLPWACAHCSGVTLYC